MRTEIPPQSGHGNRRDVIGGKVMSNGAPRGMNFSKLAEHHGDGGVQSAS